MKSTKFDYLVSMIKYFFKKMDMMDELLDIRINYFFQAQNFNFQSNQDSFFQAYYFNFQTNQDIYFVKHIKALEKISKELIPIVWHPQRWWNFACQKMRKKNQI